MKDGVLYSAVQPRHERCVFALINVLINGSTGGLLTHRCTAASLHCAGWNLDARLIDAMPLIKVMTGHCARLRRQGQYLPPRRSILRRPGLSAYDVYTPPPVYGAVCAQPELTLENSSLVYSLNGTFGKASTTCMPRCCICPQCMTPFLYK